MTTTLNLEAQPTRIWDGNRLPIETVQAAAAELGWGEVRPNSTGLGAWAIDVPDDVADDLALYGSIEVEADDAEVVFIGDSTWQ